MAQRAGDLDTSPARLAEDLADRRARSIRALLLATVAVVIALALLAAVRSIVTSFSGTVEGLDEQLEKVLREGGAPPARRRSPRSPS